MKPSIQFHRIVSIRVTPVAMLNATRDDLSPNFWTRRLVIVDGSGQEFEIPLFSYAGADALRILPEKPEKEDAR